MKHLTPNDILGALNTSIADAICAEELPELTEDERGYILWNETGYPWFWPDSRLTPEQNLRNQLRGYRWQYMRPPFARLRLWVAWCGYAARWFWWLIHEPYTRGRGWLLDAHSRYLLHQRHNAREPMPPPGGRRIQ